MGRQKKDAKGRLDKYYKLAKEHGYRSRSAFKLVQINKQFDFLQKTRCLVDLCAAPGGWLQVAKKYMPVSSLIVGVDLVPIQAIKGVTLIEGDITTRECRSKLKAALHESQADVFLHDGSPNMGSAWNQDAYVQCDLVLASLKLACEFLMPGGWFITKVFRSSDYNKLLWIFGKLFYKVVSTKPPSSRNTSAEIYVICQGFNAPKDLDPKMLDYRYAFKEIDNNESCKALRSIIHPEKKTRMRNGYENELYKETNLSEFIESKNYLNILAESSLLKLNETRVEVPEEVKETCSDLKVLSRKDFRDLIKWRKKVRLDLGMDKVFEKKAILEEQEKTPLEQAEDDLKALRSKEKRELRKKKEAKARSLLRKTNTNMQDEIISSENNALRHVLISNEKYDYESSSEDESQITGQVGQNIPENIPEDLSEDERLAAIEEELDEMYNFYMSKKNKKNLSKAIKEDSFDDKMCYYAEYEGGEELEGQQDHINQQSQQDHININQQSQLNQQAIQTSTENLPQNFDSSALKFFSDPLFDSLDPKLFSSKTCAESHPLKVKSEPSKGEILAENAITTPELYTLAQKYATKSGKRELLESSYNRYAHEDLSNLPVWLRSDIQRNHKPNLPVTKSAVGAIREKNQAINARPIRKIAEAKLRKRMRVARAIKRANKKTEGADASEPSPAETSKLTQAQEAIRKSKKTKKKVSVVVAKGANKGVKGRPRGVKGKYKIVDSRMRKDLRSKKFSNKFCKKSSTRAKRT